MVEPTTFPQRHKDKKTPKKPTSLFFFRTFFIFSGYIVNYFAHVEGSPVSASAKVIVAAADAVIVVLYARLLARSRHNGPAWKREVLQLA